MWSNRFFRSVANRLPLERTGFCYYVNYLKLIDHRALNAPIFGSSVVLKNACSVRWQDARTTLKCFRKTLIYSLPGFNSFVRVIRPTVKQRSNTHRVVDDEARNIIRKGAASDVVSDVFDLSALNRHLPNLSAPIIYRAATLILYLQEIERRFAGKIS